MRSGRSRSSASATSLLTPRTFEPPDPGAIQIGTPAGLGHHRGPGPRGGRSAFSPDRREPRQRDDLAPDPDGRVRSRRLAALAGDGRRDHRDPALDPVLGRRRGGRSHPPRSATTWRRPIARAAGALRGGPIDETCWLPCLAVCAPRCLGAPAPPATPRPTMLEHLILDLDQCSARNDRGLTDLRAGTPALGHRRRTARGRMASTERPEPLDRRQHRPRS